MAGKNCIFQKGNIRVYSPDTFQDLKQIIGSSNTIVQPEAFDKYADQFGKFYVICRTDDGATFLTQELRPGEIFDENENNVSLEEITDDPRVIGSLENFLSQNQSEKDYDSYGDNEQQGKGFFFENRKRKKVVRLTESQLNRLIGKCVKRILKESRQSFRY